MSKTAILESFAQSPQQRKLRESIAQSAQRPVKLQVKGLIGSALSFVITNAFKETDNPFLLIFNDKEEAAYYLNDLEQLIGENRVLFYPGSYRRPYQIEETDNANIRLRAEVLNQINSRKKPAVIVTYPDALFEKVVTRKELQKNTLKIKVGDEFSTEFINEALFEYNFNRVDFVTEPGEFSVRGGIIDVFSFSNDAPYRLEFFGDEVDSIREFDIQTQLSTDKIKTAKIMPNVENKMVEESRESFLNYIKAKTVIFLKNFDLCGARLDELFEKAETAFTELSDDIEHDNPKDLFCDRALLKRKLQDFTVAELGNQVFLQNSSPDGDEQDKVLNRVQDDSFVVPEDNSLARDDNVIEFHTKPQPSFNKKFELLTEDLIAHQRQGYTNTLFCASKKQAKRFHDIFEAQQENTEEGDTAMQYKTTVLSLHQGFIDEVGKQVCYTDHQIFERYHKFRLKTGYTKKQAITLKELNSLKVGDFVVHIDHGIGKFSGLQKIDVEGQPQEAIKLIYAKRDVLYLSIHSLHKISKYNGKDGAEPTLHKLGGTAWARKKKKTKTKVKHIAFDLIKLYAKRRMKEGFKFGPDDYMQHELEASFIYEDTPDQGEATEAVKKDMENLRPMDRLVCGDVGFGKTEVAIRAAFKAVANGKQVAVLVPTTILAFQHHRTFTERLAEMPVTIDYLNRFRTGKERRNVLENLKTGKIDILIGTHQLTNKKIKFNDLGLLIVDEEQKFGVNVKDKLKTLKENVDTLTLTATPIPRTLQFSLMSARDLSTITTPPPNRFPVETNAIRFSEELIRDGISYEIERGGQVFFVHNRIDNIKEMAGMIQRLVPDAQIGVGHGQMEGKTLEELMLRFIQGEFDVLVSTTIIENGLDVPNANTMFINNAHNFGLSDLHQMRGRVGRSNKKAFCYFITPPYSVMTEDARKRIEALEQFTDLGSGINIAMKDLEIRGAGDLLGGEQSGFINDLGFDTYQKILNEAIEELKENEFKELYQETEDIEDKVFVQDVQIDTDFALQFPDDYINNITERLNLYKKLNDLKTEEELKQFEKELIDRFGELPSQAVDLLNSVRIKWIAQKIGLEKVVMKRRALIGYFIANQDSRFYQTENFTKVLQYVQTHPSLCTLKEKETRQGLRLLLRFDNIDSVDKGLDVLAPLDLRKENAHVEESWSHQGLKGLMNFKIVAL